MIRANIHQIKAQLSKYIEMVEGGERVVVCKRNIPVAEIRPLPEESDRPSPVLGSGLGQGRVLPGFDEPLSDEELALWEDESADSAK